MISAGEGILTGTLLAFRSLKLGRRGWRGVRRGLWPVGVTAASWCGSVPRGRGWPAARRGRHRTKAERADRQRRGSPRAHRARLSARAAQFTPDSGLRQRARD
jgi:hypothetical protein